MSRQAKPASVRAAQAPVRFYRKYISPLKPPRCRYYPTCSQYALDALEEYGAVQGMWMATKRICRCHPFHPGGIDPVPPNPRKRTNPAEGKEPKGS
nr:membrane protein insertion efficiency factor YidD [Gorillibacterium timonense]